ncbi:MAG: helix-turn-helix transcriptional regulator [Bacilli bacterium]|nr:helix-turn-helix transcriptional regulator [Bacilli bacterium]MBQ9011987.1 helix-turn-helix transcriptional regulator [Bacilli bacterium]
MTIGDNIKKYRKKNKLTQKQLGEMINKSTISIRKYESNSIKPSIEVLFSLTNALNVTIDDLVNEENINQVDFEVSFLEGLTKELIPGTSYHTLDDNGKKQIEKAYKIGSELIELIQDEKLHTIIKDTKELEVLYHSFINGVSEKYETELEYKDHIIKMQEDRINQLENTVNKLFSLLGGDTNGQ